MHYNRVAIVCIEVAAISEATIIECHSCMYIPATNCVPILHVPLLSNIPQL
jgi:hypothetical protein